MGNKSITSQQDKYKTFGANDVICELKDIHESLQKNPSKISHNGSILHSTLKQVKYLIVLWKDKISCTPSNEKSQREGDDQDVDLHTNRWSDSSDGKKVKAYRSPVSSLVTSIFGSFQELIIDKDKKSLSLMVSYLQALFPILNILNSVGDESCNPLFVSITLKKEDILKQLPWEDMKKTCQLGEWWYFVSKYGFISYLSVDLDLERFVRIWHPIVPTCDIPSSFDSNQMIENMNMSIDNDPYCILSALLLIRVCKEMREKNQELETYKSMKNENITTTATTSNLISPTEMFTKFEYNMLLNENIKRIAHVGVLLIKVYKVKYHHDYLDQYMAIIFSLVCESNVDDLRKEHFSKAFLNVFVEKTLSQKRMSLFKLLYVLDIVCPISFVDAILTTIIKRVTETHRTKDLIDACFQFDITGPLKALYMKRIPISQKTIYQLLKIECKEVYTRFISFISPYLDMIQSGTLTYQLDPSKMNPKEDFEKNCENICNIVNEYLELMQSHIHPTQKYILYSLYHYIPLFHANPPSSQSPQNPRILIHSLEIQVLFSRIMAFSLLENQRLRLHHLNFYHCFVGAAESALNNEEYVNPFFVTAGRKLNGMGKSKEWLYQRFEDIIHENEKKYLPSLVKLSLNPHRFTDTIIILYQ